MTTTHNGVSSVPRYTGFGVSVDFGLEIPLTKVKNVDNKPSLMYVDPVSHQVPDSKILMTKPEVPREFVSLTDSLKKRQPITGELSASAIYYQF